jgi:hypothetical protein
MLGGWSDYVVCLFSRTADLNTRPPTCALPPFAQVAFRLWCELERRGKAKEAATLLSKLPSPLLDLNALKGAGPDIADLIRCECVGVCMCVHHFPPCTNDDGPRWLSAMSVCVLVCVCVCLCKQRDAYDCEQHEIPPGAPQHQGGAVGPRPAQRTQGAQGPADQGEGEQGTCTPPTCHADHA